MTSACSPETLALDATTTTELRLARADVGAPAPAVLVLPALGIPARYYDPFVLALAQRGVHTAAADYRGAGASNVRPGRDVDFGYDDLVADAALVARALAERTSAREVIFLGHSLGGHLSLLAASRGAAVSRVALVASGSPWARVFGAKHGAGLRVLAALAPPLSAVLGHYPGRTLRFGGREARTLMRDWSRVVLHGTFGAEHERALARVSLPVLAVALEGDAWAPRASVEALLAKVPACDVTRDTYTGGPPVDHNRWPRTPDWFADRVAAWSAEPKTAKPPDGVNRPGASSPSL